MLYSRKDLTNYCVFVDNIVMLIGRIDIFPQGLRVGVDYWIRVAFYTLEVTWLEVNLCISTQVFKNLSPFDYKNRVELESVKTEFGFSRRTLTLLLEARLLSND